MMIYDYYPFGMPMPYRRITDANAYRYAYQGQEKDPETGKEAFELRLWDGRIGRWLTTDPYGQHFSPYLGMGNNPISTIDPDGGTNCGGAGQPPCEDGGWEMDLPAVEIGSNSIDYRGFDADFPTWTSSFNRSLADWSKQYGDGYNFTDSYEAYDYWSNQQMQTAQKEFNASIYKAHNAVSKVVTPLIKETTLMLIPIGEIYVGSKLIYLGVTKVSKFAIHGTRVMKVGSASAKSLRSTIYFTKHLRKLNLNATFHAPIIYGRSHTVGAFLGRNAPVLGTGLVIDGIRRLNNNFQKQDE